MHKLFVTQVYHAKINHDLLSLTEESLLIQKNDKNGQKWSKLNYKNGYTSYGSWDQLHRFSSNIESLQKKIDKHVFKYAKSLAFDIDKKSLKINSMWINIMGKGALHSAHIHPQSVISGTYYIQTPPLSSAIKFEDPRLGYYMNSPELKKNAKLSLQRFVSLQPKASDLVLFESWLKHEVPRNESSTPRISLSFNYGWSQG